MLKLSVTMSSSFRHLNFQSFNIHNHHKKQFSGIFNNPLFLVILGIEALAHVLLVIWGGVVFQTAYDPPIPLLDWLIAVG